MFKKPLKTVLFLSIAVTGMAFADGPCEFCDLLYQHCLSAEGPLKKPAEQCYQEYVQCREMDCQAP